MTIKLSNYIEKYYLEGHGEAWLVSIDIPAIESEHPILCQEAGTMTEWCDSYDEAVDLVVSTLNPFGDQGNEWV